MVNRSTKIWSYNAIGVAFIHLYSPFLVATYACGTWKIAARIVHELNVFHQRYLRKILDVTYRDRVTNEELQSRAGSRKLSDIVTEPRFCLAGHVLRIPIIALLE